MNTRSVIVSVFLILAGIILPPSLPAQSPSLSFNHLTVENGLPTGHVVSIFKDSRGFMWFGTDDGLCRFDGINCKVYKHSEKDSTSIRGTRIGYILEDREGNLWITSNEALNCYMRNEDRFKSFIIKSGTQSNNFIHTIFGWKNDSTLIFQNAKDEYCNFSIPSKKFSLTDSLDYIRYLLEQSARKGNHFAVISNQTGHGISVWRYEKDVPVHYDFFNPESHSNLSHLAFGQMMVESDTLAWMKCEKGLIAFNPATKHYVLYNPLLHGQPNFTLLFDRGNQFLIGSENGLWIFDKQQRKYTAHFEHEGLKPESLSGDNIADAGLLDNNNNLWLQVFAKGIDYATLNQKKFIHYLDEKEAQSKGLDNFIRCMAEDSAGNVWCGTMRNHLYVFNKKKELIADYSRNIGKENSGTVVCLLRDQQNRMWVVNNQLYVFNPSAKTFQSIPGIHNATNITQLHNGTIIFTEWHGGIFKVNESTGKFFVVPTAINGLFNERQAIYEDHEHRIYMISPALSLDVYSSLNDSQPIHSLKIHAEVKSFYESPDDSLIWIATSQGLLRLNKTNFSYRFVTTKDGLPNDFVYSVLPDKEARLPNGQGNLWMSTNSGICKFDPDKFAFRSYTTNDGLQSNEFNTNGYVLCRDGEMWFSGVNGFNAFYPDQIKDNTIVPQIQITAMKVDDENFSPRHYIGETEALRLSYNQRTVSFDFTGMEFSDAQRVQLQYKMSGVDKNWIAAKNPGFARYANLPPGNYSFQIKAANSDGVFNPGVKTLTIAIATPFFLSWWFYVLITITAALLLYTIYRYRINQILKLQAERNRIARDLHDSVGSSLGSISYYSQLLRKTSFDENEEAKTMLNDMEQLSRQTVESMSDIVWAINPLNESLEKLVSRMRNYSGEIFSAKGIGVTIQVDESLEVSSRLSIEQRKNLFLIFKEAVYNAVKYGECKNIKVHLKKNKNVLTLMITDEGIGFNEQEVLLNGGNGLRNMRARATEMKGELTIQSSSSGTTIEVKLAL